MEQQTKSSIELIKEYTNNGDNWIYYVELNGKYLKQTASDTLQEALNHYNIIKEQYCKNAKISLIKEEF